MTKKYLVLSVIAIAMASVAVNAAPVYTNDLGGLQYNNVSGAANSKAVNDAMDKYTVKQEAKTSASKEVENYTLPASSNTKYSFGRGTVDTSNEYGHSVTPASGVNSSKTIYRDDLGRLHFFGKKNIIKE